MCFFEKVATCLPARKESFPNKHSPSSGKLFYHVYFFACLTLSNYPTKLIRSKAGLPKETNQRKPVRPLAEAYFSRN